MTYEELLQLADEFSKAQVALGEAEKAYKEAKTNYANARIKWREALWLNPEMRKRYYSDPE